jgi:two-component system, NarL family, captular synthesis response regulator RcsB
MFLLGLRVILSKNRGDHELVDEARSGRELLHLLSSHSCDLVITDFCMRSDEDSLDGLDLIREIHALYPSLPILIITMFNNSALIKGMLHSGACGVVDKSAMSAEIDTAIRAVSSGRVYLSDCLRKKLEVFGNTKNICAKEVLPELSAREAEILRMISRGLTVTNIARTTGRSVKTVSQQKKNAMRKLGIAMDRELFEYVRSHGL